jgi:hypothetical protein
MFLLSLLPPDALAKRPPPPVPAGGSVGIQSASLKQRAHLIDNSMGALRSVIAHKNPPKELMVWYRSEMERVAAIPGLTEYEIESRISALMIGQLQGSGSRHDGVKTGFSRAMLRRSADAFSAM